VKRIQGPLAVAGLGFLLGLLLCVCGLVQFRGESFYYYLLSLVVAGALAALPSPRWFWLAPFAIFAGQVVYKSIGHPIGGGYWIAGLIIGGMYNLISMAGALFTAWLWSLRRKDEAHS
jgi:hypothetical protein